MQTLSPRKYVQTNVRSLPVCKCLVNADWEEIRLAHVTVMRQHTTNNVTIGIYTVDLLCLGIKDTLFFFNTPLQEFLDKYQEQLTTFKEIEYNLAHNIVYAGHDFALEYNIYPHHDFEITRFILGEDDNAIPYIEVPVGVNGLPHLIETNKGQHAGVLARLKQYAGEGNYYYSIEPAQELVALPVNDTQEVTIWMDDLPAGEICLGNVQAIDSDDLFNVEKVQQRSLLEQMIIHAEVLTRLLPAAVNTCTPAEEAWWNELWDEMSHSAAQANNIPDTCFDEYLFFTKQADAIIEHWDSTNEQKVKSVETKMIALFNQYADNPLCVQTVYEQAVLFDLEHVSELAKQQALTLYEQYPVLYCSLAFGSLIQETPNDRFKALYTQPDIRMALPGYEQYHTSEITNFWLMHLWLCLEQNNLKSAVQYYYMLVDGKVTGWLLLPVLEKYVETLYSAVRQ